MSQRLALVFVFATVAATAVPSPVVASIEPLVVVVETGRGGGVDPAEVRQAIATELRTSVRAPRDPAVDETSDLMIVTVDRAEIRMSVRPRAAGVVSRVVPAPNDRKARLQSIGWLAGNLARDQVSAIVAPVPVLASVPAASVEAPEVPSAAPPPATEPPRLTEDTALARGPALAGVITAQPAPTVVDVRHKWSLSIGGGPSGLGDRTLWPGPAVWSLEVQRRPSAGGLFFGAALDVGPDVSSALRSSSFDFIGGAALVGVGHSFTRAFVEATAGLGLEAYQAGSYMETTTSNGGSQTTVTTSIAGFVLGLYVRGQATAGLTLSKSFDLLASVSGHLGNVGYGDHFTTSSLGVRFHFPQ